VTAMDTILVVNAGSSSVKFQVFAVDGDGRMQRQIKGQMDGIGSRPRLRATGSDGDPVADRAFAIDTIPDLTAALAAARDWLRDERGVTPLAVGHRVVHGGPDYDRPVMIDHAVVTRLERLSSLAPLHQPYNLAPMRSLLTNFPTLPQVACFDTAFHRSHSPLADHYAIPRQLHVEGVRRYGFHGLSYEYIAKALPQIAPDIAGGRVIVAHLGSGASMCALKAAQSVESTMISEKGMSASNVQNFLYRECGLKGLSGLSNDMRELEASKDPHAAFAVDYFVYRAGLNAGMLAAALQGIDAFVFTAGIGENSVGIRERIGEKLAWLGVKLDPGANSIHALKISRPDSRVPVYIVPTDEELMIAQHTLSLLMSGKSPGQKQARVS
jgi:acetate kinase